MLLGVAGSPALPHGGAFIITSNASRTVLSASGWMSHESPSRVFGPALAEGLDLSRGGGALRAERTHVGDAWDASASLSALGEWQDATVVGESTRGAAIGLLSASARQRSNESRFEERFAIMGEAGGVDSGSYLRHRGEFVFGTATGPQPLATFRASFGNVSGDGSRGQRFVLGGLPSPLIDSLYDARRVSLAAYPVASLSGNSFTAYRVGLPVSSLELFYAGGTTDLFRHQPRRYGAEMRQEVSAIAALGTPDVTFMAGVARAVDEPKKGDWQFYLTLRLRP